MTGFSTSLVSAHFYQIQISKIINKREQKVEKIGGGDYVGFRLLIECGYGMLACIQMVGFAEHNQKSQIHFECLTPRNT